MNAIDFSTYKFHPSGLRYLMTNSRSKSEPLSETTKSYLNEVFIEEVFGRKKLITSAPMSKGTAVESDSLDLVQKVLGKTYFKNQKKFSNEYLEGTPDVVSSSENQIIDIKSSWDIWTYAKVTADSAKKDYYWQVLAYGWITGLKNLSLIYALVNTPDFIIHDELYRLSFKLPPDADTEPYKINYLFDDIPDNLKIKRFDFEYNDDKIIEVIERVKLSRLYLSSLTLNVVMSERIV